MGFFNQYPYTDFHEMNLDWVLAKIKELDDRVSNISDAILADAKAYTDEQLAGYQQQVNDIRTEFTNLVNGLSDEVDGLKTAFNIAVAQMDLKITYLENLLAAEIAAVNQRTDLAIQQNNVYILSQLREFLGEIEVVNALTGTYMTIQNMFNYLCTLHMTDAIDYTTLASRNNTYTQLAGYYMTYTQLAMQGNTIIQ